MSNTISTYLTPLHLPGERAHDLITPDGCQIAWAARPDDRRGASLLFDGLAATGVEWRNNPVSRVDIAVDFARLVARLRVRGTSRIIITNAHYLVPTVRQLAIDLATAADADLVFSYEDGQGTTLHGTGLLDDAERHRWPCHPEHEPPFLVPSPDAMPEPARQPDEPQPFPRLVSTVGFVLFRGWNRQLLEPDEFALLDELYCHAYAQTRALADPTATQIAALAQELLTHPHRSGAITALRAMQAALFRSGVLWRLPLSTLDDWRESSASRRPTDADYQRLQEILDHETAAIAVLASLDYSPEDMTRLRLQDKTVLGAGLAPRTVPTPALMPLRVSAALNHGPLVTHDARRIRLAIRELTQKFDFPLLQTRGAVSGSQNPLDATNLRLIPYQQGATP